MSEKNIILLEDISSSQTEGESVVRAAAIDDAISLFPFVASEEKTVGERDARCLVGGLERPIEEGDVRQTEVRTLMWRTRTLIFLVVLWIWEFLGTNLRDSNCQRSFEGIHSKKILCPRVLWTLFIFHNVNFQIFKLYR